MAFRRPVPTDFDDQREVPASQIKTFHPKEGSVGTNFHGAQGLFGLKPKTFQMCKKHRSSRIEFYCEVTNDFYCRLCAPQHKTHAEDKVVAEIASKVQDMMTELKHLYLTKKSLVIDRLVQQQREIEGFFKIYYD